ncbi:MAG: cob(I)yrinic acid a,c-diamide adenosyltransferase [Trueperaceae bacterium]|nr:MAG: cob(I)yrinic acid a,c-diamide adenosyltransferase [Trueperaceae bacterium]
MKIYTKTGDGGTTALYGGRRVSKSDLRVRAYGSVDEVSALLGLVRSHLQDAAIDRDLGRIQDDLFVVGADLATPFESRFREKIDPVRTEQVDTLEKMIDGYDAELEPLQSFILPGGHPVAAWLHYARAVARRAEREVVEVAAGDQINTEVIGYLNRLSDLLFMIARVVNRRMGVGETPWRGR